MKDARPALRYAKAILDLAIENNSETAVNEDMKLIVQTITESQDLATALKSPVLKVTDKINILNSIFTGKVNAVTLGLFNLLKDNKRIPMLESIAKQYAIIYNFSKNIQFAKVTTAVAITKEIEDKVAKKIVELTGNKATIENVINPNIIGGFILRVGDVQYDASISNHLNELRKDFDNSQYIPKI